MQPAQLVVPPNQSSCFCEPVEGFFFCLVRKVVCVLYMHASHLSPQFPSFVLLLFRASSFSSFYTSSLFILYFFASPTEEETRSRLFFMLKSRTHTRAAFLLPLSAAACCSPCEKARGGKQQHVSCETKERDSSAPEAELLLKIMFSPRIIFARMKNVLSDGDNSWGMTRRTPVKAASLRVCVFVCRLASAASLLLSPTYKTLLHHPEKCGGVVDDDDKCSASIIIFNFAPVWSVEPPHHSLFRL